MKLIAVGDNVTDCYLNEGVFYPGGCCVNVAVNSKRDGAEEVGYLGVFGNDVNALHIQDCLDKEGVDHSMCRTVMIQSSKPGVNIDADGDRIFVEGPKRTCQWLLRLQLRRDDLEYIRKFDIIHTCCFSSIEPELPNLAKCGEVAYDFSERRDEEYLRQVCPYLTYAFFSGSDMTEDAVPSLQAFCQSLGVKVVGITRGGEGAVFSENGTVYRQGITPTEVVDTMGAGDSFIAGFLTHYGDHHDMAAALAFASERAAFTCTQHGGFGYPHPFVEEWPGYDGN